jgi:hypothetical protein
MTDFYWSLDGDLAYGTDGDIRDTSFDACRSLFQEIRTRCQSAFRDWELHPTLGANLDSLLGRLNNRFTAEEGKASIINALIQGGFLPKKSINVRYMPISRNRLMYSVRVTVMVGSGETRMLKTQLLYDTAEDGLTVI